MAGAQVEFLLTPFVNGSGSPLSGGEIKFFIAGTTTPIDVYDDKDLVTNVGNTVILDSRGIANVFVDGLNFLKIEIREEAGGTLLDTKDGLSYRGGLEDQGLYYLLDGSRALQGDMDVSGYDLVGCGNVNISTGKVLNVNHGHSYTPTGSDMNIMGDTNAVYREFTIGGSLFTYENLQVLKELTTSLYTISVGLDITGTSTHHGVLNMDDNKIQGGALATVHKDFVTLDSNNKIPTDIIPDSVLGKLEYKGTWNASTNTPTLTSSVGTQGDYYVVNVAGSTNLDGVTDWQIGDWAVFNGTIWEKIDNTDQVTSVFGRQGVIVAQTSDYDASQVDNDSTVDSGSGNVATAMEHLDSEKVERDGSIPMTGPLTLFGVPSGDQAAKFNQIPTSNSSLTNDSGYQTASQVQTIASGNMATLDGDSNSASATSVSFTITAPDIGVSGANAPGFSLGLTGSFNGTFGVLFSGSLTCPVNSSTVYFKGSQIAGNVDGSNTHYLTGAIARNAAAVTYASAGGPSNPVSVGYRRVDDDNIELTFKEVGGALVSDIAFSAEGSIFGSTL